MRELRALYVVRSTMREKGYTESEVNMILGESAAFLLDRQETAERETLESRQRHRRKQALKEFEPIPFPEEPVDLQLVEAYRNGRGVSDDGSFDPHDYEV